MDGLVLDLSQSLARAEAAQSGDDARLYEALTSVCMCLGGDSKKRVG